MRNLILLLIAVLTVASACQSNEKKVTESGYPYEHHLKKGGVTPQPGEYVSFHVQMRNGDSVIVSSRQQPNVPKIMIPEPPTDAESAKRVSPLIGALKLMSEGDSLTLFYPIDTLPQKPKNFENADFMIYDLVLLDIMSAEEYQAEAEEMRKKQEAERATNQARESEVAEQVKSIAAEYTSGALADKIQTTDSGLKYIIHEDGTGETAKPRQTVKVQYYGALTDGEQFDNSFKRGTPFTFPLGAGQVIRGWDEGVALLKKGSKATFFIPSELGYGAAGSPPRIPGGSELIFYIEVEDIL